MALLAVASCRSTWLSSLTTGNDARGEGEPSWPWGSVAFCTVFTPPHCFSLMSAVPVPASLLEDAPKGFAPEERDADLHRIVGRAVLTRRRKPPEADVAARPPPSQRLSSCCTGSRAAG